MFNSIHILNYFNVLNVINYDYCFVDVVLGISDRIGVSKWLYLEREIVRLQKDERMTEIDHLFDLLRLRLPIQLWKQPVWQPNIINMIKILDEKKPCTYRELDLHMKNVLPKQLEENPSDNLNNQIRSTITKRSNYSWFLWLVRLKSVIV